MTIKKFIAVLLAITCFGSVFMFNVSATDYSKYYPVSGSDKFEEEWVITAFLYYEDSNERAGTIEYGYDELFFNEDYVNTKGLDYSTKASVKRMNYDTDYNYGDPAAAGKWSGVSVRHYPYTVRYRITFIDAEPVVKG